MVVEEEGEQETRAEQVFNTEGVDGRVLGRATGVER